jgi:hypothetical protein
MEVITRMVVVTAIMSFALEGLWFHPVTGFAWHVPKMLDLLTLALRAMSMLTRILIQHYRRRLIR